MNIGTNLLPALAAPLLFLAAEATREEVARQRLMGVAGPMGMERAGP